MTQAEINIQTLLLFYSFLPFIILLISVVIWVLTKIVLGYKLNFIPPLWLVWSYIVLASIWMIVTKPLTQAESQSPHYSINPMTYEWSFPKRWSEDPLAKLREYLPGYLELNSDAYILRVQREGE